MSGPEAHPGHWPRQAGGRGVGVRHAAAACKQHPQFPRACVDAGALHPSQPAAVLAFASQSYPCPGSCVRGGSKLESGVKEHGTEINKKR